MFGKSFGIAVGFDVLETNRFAGIFLVEPA
jgi:hypothetical protein